MKIVNSIEMGEIDRKAQTDFSIPGIILMENAGIKLYNCLYKDVWKNNIPEKALFISGKGNNGGDVLVMARQHHLSGRNCTVLIPDCLFKEGLTLTHYKICSALGIKIIEWKNDREEALSYIENADWIIEGLSGTGLRGELQNIPVEIVEKINSSYASVCSIDIPSGIGDSYKEGFTAVNADFTLTVEIPKFSLFTPAGRKKCGIIKAVPIGFPPSLTNNPDIKDHLICESDIKSFIPPPSPYTYKNEKGHTLVLAGSSGMTGAAKLCSLSALNSLSGLVTLKVTEEILRNISDLSPSLLTGIEDFSSYDESILEKYSSLVLGPGWGITHKKRNWLKAFLSRSNTKCVIDADALTLLTELINDGFIIKNRNCIITPHIGEFSRISGLEKQKILNNPYPLIRDFSIKHNITTVLKSHVTWISDNAGNISIVDGNNPAMATAGSGDILAGIIAGLLSYGLDSYKAASAAVLLHQKAGLLCYNDNGFFESERMINYIGTALKDSFNN